MADALVSPAVAGVAAVVSVSLLGVAAKKVRHSANNNIVPLMGVMGAFVFAAQMINFSIPGTGSSGHIVGGVLMASVLGPWAALLTIASVLVVQCLIFADGGLMALGCNILNMGIMSTLVAYPLIFRPIMGRSHSMWRLVAASMAACVVGLELGALLVTAETSLSGVTALPVRDFLALMTSIHLFIGLGEGVATAAVLCFVARYRPDMIYRDQYSSSSVMRYRRVAPVVWVLAGVALVLAGVFTWVASGDPDGLEWSISRITGVTDIEGAGSAIGDTLAGVQGTMSVLPDYESTWSGIIGCGIVVAIVWILATLLARRSKVHA